jgi:DNA mismatch repair protein MutS
MASGTTTPVKPAGAKLTPVMEQHAQAKRAFPDALVFFRMGDFYELFGEDAGVASRVLNLTLTSRNKGKPDEIPMAGVPHHAGHNYIGRLLAAGYKVAICEQMADPKTVKGIVPRDVVRVLTPGLVTSDDQLQARQNNWLAGIDVGPKEIGLALLDISTGELRCAKVPGLTELLAELHHAGPREVLLGQCAAQVELEAALADVLSGVPVRSDQELSETEQVNALGALAADVREYAACERRAAARVLRFARLCTPLTPLPVRAVGRWDPASCLVLDPSAVRHLELVESNTGDRALTLLAILDQTETAPGARLLRRRLLAPLTDVAEIRRRHDQVELFVVHAAVRDRLRKALAGVGDLERLVSRIELGEGSPRDLGAVRDTLVAGGAALNIVLGMSQAEREVLLIAGNVDPLPELSVYLSSALVERPPVLAKEGAIFAPEFDDQLKELELTKRDGNELVVALEARLRDETSISSVKVRFTRVFGWYIEVSRTGAGKVPKDWRRKQTVATGERYTVDALDELAEKLASAEEKHRERELQLLRELNERVRACAARLRAFSATLAVLDVAVALAEVAHRHDYCRPSVDLSSQLSITDGRHPVVERLAALGRFVPNDVSLDAEATRLWTITGPNMAGKSTFLRQVALSAILAQMGSFVPAKQAHIGIVDRVLSRVGASDNLAQGQSTFMVEMRETAEILRFATPRSLVILDEIGRGTSTFDGLSIAWAVAEHLDDVCRCRALFATHYHELTELATLSEHVANYSVSAREQGGDVVFLHRVVAGAASRSYGIAVAKLAGLPEVVLARARALLAGLEGEAGATATPGPKRRGQRTNQLDLFGAGAEPRASAPAELEVCDTLRAVNLERVSPLDAHALLAKLKKRLS